MVARFWLSVFLFTFGVHLGGCSHVQRSKERSPKVLFESACGLGKSTQSVTGSLWMKVESPEASGQFPAVIQVEGSQLDMEVTNLIGGTEAIIRVRGDEYVIEKPGTEPKKGKSSWGGIPLVWAAQLFLGKIPCTKVYPSQKIYVESEGDLVVQNLGDTHEVREEFRYSFIDWQGAPWPSSLHWERKGDSPVVDFKFESPESKTLAPLEWEASSVLGKVKVRWKHRSSKS